MAGEKPSKQEQVAADDILWEKAPKILSKGHHLEDVPIEGFDIDETILVLHEPAWWGVSMGNPQDGIAFAVRATNKNEALDKVAVHLGRDDRHRLPIPSWELHPDSYEKDGQEVALHESLDQRYPDRDVVRVQLFSIDEYPDAAAA